MPFKLYSRPRDRSLEAFKDWMQGMAYRAKADGAAPMETKLWIDDEQWTSYWSKFWEKVDRASAGGTTRRTS